MSLRSIQGHCKWQHFLLPHLNNIPSVCVCVYTHIYTTSSLSYHLLMDTWVVSIAVKWGVISSRLCLSTEKNSPRGKVIHAAAAAKSLQSCLTLCDPTDGSPPGSPVPGILQARILEWVVIKKWFIRIGCLWGLQVSGWGACCTLRTYWATDLASKEKWGKGEERH